MSAADPSVAHSVAPAAAAYMGSEPAATGHPDPEKDSRLPSALGSKEKYQSPEETLLQSSGIVVPSRTTGTKIVSSGGPYGDDLHVKRRGPFSSWKHAAAVFNFGFLISSWVFGIASPLVLAFLIWNRWFTLALVMASAMAYPLLFPVRPWPLVRWLFASVLAPHAYYQPHGWSVSFQRGALQALQRRDAGEYYRERAKRRKRAGRLVKPTAHILPSGDTAANVSVVADVDSTAAQASVSGPVASLTLGTTQLLRPESKGDDSAGERSDCEQDELDLLSPISSAVEAAAAAAADAVDAVDATAAAAAAAAAAGSSAKDEGAGPSSPHARRPVLAAFHPHGIFPVSFWLGGAICSELFTINPNMTFLISSALYSAPMFLFIIRWMGKFAPADAASTAALMAKGEDIGLIPGGFEEATIYRHGHHRLFLKSRRGFIKYALRYGYTVVPVYSFGEEQSYYNATCFTRLRLRLNKWQIPGVFPWGAPGVLPFSSHAMDIVYGEPLELPLTPQPSDEEVALWHGRYVERVKETFERNKARFGQPDAQLEIW